MSDAQDPSSNQQALHATNSDGVADTAKRQRMKPGDRWIGYLPYKLAYGEGGKGPIPPAADLVFEVELVSVQP